MYYFAYGSNLNWPQMQRRCPSSRFVSIARLPDYQFGITRHSRLRNCGTANVIAARGGEVWGALYDICDEELLILDGFEDGYSREILPVFGLNGEEAAFQALVYVAQLEVDVPLPNAEYKQLILEGAKHWKLPSIYLSILEKIEAAG